MRRKPALLFYKRSEGLSIRGGIFLYDEIYALSCLLYGFAVAI